MQGTDLKVSGMPGHLIRRLHQKSTQVFTSHMQNTDFDLTSVQFAAMEAIINQPGIDQAGVAGMIAYDRATIGGVIDRLEQKGYVERSVSNRDRRAKEVYPTTVGLNAFEQILPVVSDLQDEILSGLTRDERIEFLALARKAIVGKTTHVDFHQEPPRD